MIRWRTLALDLLCDMVGGILYAVGIYTFAKMANFAPGGLSGLALLMNYLWDLPICLLYTSQTMLFQGHKKIEDK